MTNRLPLTDLTIPINTSESNAVAIPKSASKLMIACLAAALTGTVTITFSFDGGSTYKTYYSGGSAVAVGVGACFEIPVMADSVKLASDGTEAAARVFALRALEEF